jgi:hypothetical protein
VRSLIQRYLAQFPGRERVPSPAVLPMPVQRAGGDAMTGITLTLRDFAAPREVVPRG